VPSAAALNILIGSIGHKNDDLTLLLQGTNSRIWPRRSIPGVWGCGDKGSRLKRPYHSPIRSSTPAANLYSYDTPQQLQSLQTSLQFGRSRGPAGPGRNREGQRGYRNTPLWHPAATSAVPEPVVSEVVALQIPQQEKFVGCSELLTLVPAAAAAEVEQTNAAVSTITTSDDSHSTTGSETPTTPFPTKKYFYFF